MSRVITAVRASVCQRARSVPFAAATAARTGAVIDAASTINATLGTATLMRLS
jgi:hypothetical protein